jgi:hypothetical protein
VDLDAQLRDALGDPSDLSSAANGVPDSVKANCIDKYMAIMGQRELRSCVACGVWHFCPCNICCLILTFTLDTACR